MKVMTTIYALIDPRCGSVRYVGKTSRNLHARLRAHINRAEGQKHIRSANWIFTLTSQGLTPRVQVLEIIDGEWESAERFWIASFRAMGADLCNMTIGGAATPGHKPNAATREKLSRASTRQFASQAARDAAAEFARKQWLDPEFKRAKVQHIRDLSATPTFRKNQSEKKKALWATDEYRRNVAAGKRPGAHAAGATKMWERPEYREARRLARERRHGMRK